jgi:hypothetical protein
MKSMPRSPLRNQRCWAGRAWHTQGHVGEHFDHLRLCMTKVTGDIAPRALAPAWRLVATVGIGARLFDATFPPPLPYEEDFEGWALVMSCEKAIFCPSMFSKTLATLLFWSSASADAMCLRSARSTNGNARPRARSRLDGPSCRSFKISHLVSSLTLDVSSFASDF